MKRSLTTIVLFGLLVFFFNNCAEKEFDITGTWSLEKTEIYIGEDLIETIEDTGEQLTFNANGSGRSGHFVFEWQLKGDSLFITEYGNTATYVIKEKENRKLVLEDREYESDMGEIHILTLKK